MATEFSQPRPLFHSHIRVCKYVSSMLNLRFQITNSLTKDKGWLVSRWSTSRNLASLNLQMRSYIYISMVRIYIIYTLLSMQILQSFTFFLDFYLRGKNFPLVKCVHDVYITTYKHDLVDSSRIILVTRYDWNV